MKTVETLLQAKGREVWSIAPGATVYECLQMLAEKGVGALPVVADGSVVGMFSERDYARRVALENRDSRQCRVEDIMTREVVCIDASCPIEQCMAIMTEKKIRHLPVYGEGKMIGIVSIGDLVKHIIAEQQFKIELLESYITG